MQNCQMLFSGSSRSPLSPFPFPFLFLPIFVPPTHPSKVTFFEHGELSSNTLPLILRRRDLTMADPLSILGGVAASIQLVQCATSTLLGTIKLIREFRDIPNQTAAHLNDVERSSERVTYVCKHVLDAGSTADDPFEADSLRRLSAGCDGLRFAVDEAEAVLKPLVEASQPGKLARAQHFWNALVSKTRESVIQQKLERIDKLNLELIGELNIAGLVGQENFRSVDSCLTSIMDCF